MTNKVCPHCEHKLPVEMFHRRANGFQSLCKICRKIADAAAYEKNKHKVKIQKAIWRKSFLDWYNSLKQGKPCVDCGGVFHVQAMHFDHLPQFKKHKSVSILYQDYDKAGILEEIKKCELVCANCHAVRTFNRRLV